MLKELELSGFKPDKLIVMPSKLFDCKTQQNENGQKSIFATTKPPSFAPSISEQTIFVKTINKNPVKSLKYLNTDFLWNGANN